MKTMFFSCLYLNTLYKLKRFINKPLIYERLLLSILIEFK